MSSGALPLRLLLLLLPLEVPPFERLLSLLEGALPSSAKPTSRVLQRLINPSIVLYVMLSLILFLYLALSLFFKARIYGRPSLRPKQITRLSKRERKVVNRSRSPYISFINLLYLLVAATSLDQPNLVLINFSISSQVLKGEAIRGPNAKGTRIEQTFQVFLSSKLRIYRSPSIVVLKEVTLSFVSSEYIY